jgi:asparagine synthase (glutamine-hydrolysing)
MRWRGTGALKRLFSTDLRAAIGERDVVRELVDGLPSDFSRWTPLAQDQYLEVRTLLSGYLLSSQGDRMLMANSVEGRFPFLDLELAGLADSLPPSYKLHVLDEKHVLKRGGAGMLPPEILARKKQPYRAPDALAFGPPGTPDWATEVTADRALADAGVFEPAAARKVLDKCLAGGAGGQFSNADNMAIVGILSTQLLHDSFIRRPPRATSQPALSTLVDHVGPCERGRSVGQNART